MHKQASLEGTSTENLTGPVVRKEVTAFERITQKERKLLNKLFVSLGCPISDCKRCRRLLCGAM